MRNPALFDANRHPCCTALLAIIVAVTALWFLRTYYPHSTRSIRAKPRTLTPKVSSALTAVAPALQTIIPGLKAQGS